MDPDPVPDGLADGIAERDPAALARCYEALANPLFRYLVAHSGDPLLAEDLVEATFLELVEQAPRLRGGLPGVRAWLFRAARNNLLDHVRKVRRRGDVPLDERRAAARPDPEPGPEQRAIGDARARLVREAMRELSADQREVLALRFGAQLTAPEIAALTGRTVGAVKALQHRGVRALDRVLAGRDDVEGLVP